MVKISDYGPGLSSVNHTTKTKAKAKTIKTFLWNNHAENVHQKVDLFKILVNNPKQPFHARNFFENKIF